MANAPLSLSGVFPPIPTPFGETGEILFDRLDGAGPSEPRQVLLLPELVIRASSP